MSTGVGREHAPLVVLLQLQWVLWLLTNPTAQHQTPGVAYPIIVAPILVAPIIVAPIIVAPNSVAPNIVAPTLRMLPSFCSVM